MKQAEIPTAAIVVIGNEILSGKTQDTNVKFLGIELAAIGIPLTEVRIVRDDVAAIIGHVNECRKICTYVFTTGGIGPTHDDITAEAIAKAFGTALELNRDAVDRIAAAGFEMTEPRLKMARIPAGATLIDNPVSRAPGFRIGNVFVLAGVPAIAQAMFHALKDQLTGGSPIHSANIDVLLKESDIAGPLESIAHRHPDVEIGSYPFARAGGNGASLVVRGPDPKRIATVIDEIRDAMLRLGGSGILSD